MNRKRKLAALSVLILLIDDDEPRKKKRSTWVRSWIARKDAGMGENLLRELKLVDPDEYRRWLRLDVETFEFFVKQLTPLIQKQDTVMTMAIPVDVKLAGC